MRRAAARIPRLARLRRARDTIDRCYGDPLQVRALAAQAGYSTYHFIRAFRAVYGVTPGQHLARRRIERARTLLANANLTVTEVGLLVGFSSSATFSSRFRAEQGVSPSAYRRVLVAAGGPPPVPGCFALMLGATAQSSQNGDAARRLGSATDPTAEEPR